jgi:hypothetical protein
MRAFRFSASRQNLVPYRLPLSHFKTSVQLLKDYLVVVRRMTPMFSVRHDHQMAAINTKHTPNGSGTKKAPKAASAVGDLILRSSIVFTARLPSGAGPELNKSLTLRRRPNWSLVNAPRRWTAGRRPQVMMAFSARIPGSPKPRS